MKQNYYKNLCANYDILRSNNKRVQQPANVLSLAPNGLTALFFPKHPSLRNYIRHTFYFDFMYKKCRSGFN